MNEDVITSEWLQTNGWEFELFFYSIGGGEDEDDKEIWVKDGKAITSNFHEAWLITDRDRLSYSTGWPYYNSETVKYISELA